MGDISILNKNALEFIPFKIQMWRNEILVRVALPTNRPKGMGILQRKRLELGALRAIEETNVAFSAGLVMITICDVLCSFEGLSSQVPAYQGE